MKLIFLVWNGCIVLASQKTVMYNDIVEWHVSLINLPESRTKLTDKSEKSGGDIFKIYLHTIKFLSPDNFPAYHMDDADFPYDEVPEDQNDR